MINNSINNFVKKILLLSTFFFIIIYFSEQILKKDQRILINKLSVANVVQKSGEIQEFLNVYINNSKIFNEYDFKQIDENSYSVIIQANSREEMNDIIEGFHDEISSISIRIVKDINDFYFLKTQYKKLEAIDYPLHLYITKENPDFLKIKIEDFESRNSANNEANYYIKITYFILISFFMSIGSMFIFRNIKLKTIKKIINALN
jgi:hypothetical protein